MRALTCDICEFKIKHEGTNNPSRWLKGVVQIRSNTDLQSHRLDVCPKCAEKMKELSREAATELLKNLIVEPTPPA